ncbi:MAG: hypothetical protein ACOCXM_07520 [Myxococcota bacterium]
MTTSLWDHVFRTHDRPSEIRVPRRDLPELRWLAQTAPEGSGQTPCSPEHRIGRALRFGEGTAMTHDPSTSSRRFARWRIGVLLVLLLAVVSWGLGVKLRQWRSHDWSRPADVTAIVVGVEPPASAAVGRLERSLRALEAVLAEEYERHTGTAATPVRFSVVGPLNVTKPPPYPNPDDGFFGRVWHAVELYRYMDAVDDHVGAAARAADVRIYMTAVSEAAGPRFVEGVAAAGDDFGLVRGVLSEDMVDQAAVAVAHEVFHCLGATDKYDAAGHSIDPGGLVAPHQTPRYPQARGEIMVGEVALGPARGRLIESVAEAGVGPRTAAEIGW